MTAYHLQQKAHVGTTYKRALTRFHRARDHKVARDFSRLNGDETRHSWFVRPSDKEGRSEEHTSELQSLMRISYAVFCLKKKQQKNIIVIQTPNSCRIIPLISYRTR